MAFGNQGQMGFQNPSQITTNTLIINTAGKGGIFVYNPNKAAGNLIFSVVATASPTTTGVSPTGDIVYQGATSYRVSGALTFIAEMGGGALNLFTQGVTSQAPFGAFSTGQITVIDNGATNRQPAISFKSPRSSVSGTQGVTFLILWGESNDTTQPAGIVANQHGSFTPLNPAEGQALFELQTSPGSIGEDTLVIGFCNINTVTDTHYRWYVDPNGKMQWGPGNATQDTDLYRLGVGLLATDNTIALGNVVTPTATAGFAELFAASGQASQINPAGLVAEFQSAKLSNVTPVVVTSTFANISTAYTIPANDAQVGSTYAIEAYGFGTEGTTSQALNFDCFLGAAELVNVTLPAATFGASAAFKWHVRTEISCLTTGSSATWNASIILTIQTSAGPALVYVNTSTGSVVSSVVSETFVIAGGWGSTTGAPTMTKTTDHFEKVS